MSELRYKAKVTNLARLEYVAYPGRRGVSWMMKNGGLSGRGQAGSRWVTGGTTWSLVCKVSLVSIFLVQLTDIHLVQPERGYSRKKRVLIGKHQKVN